jgi:chromate transporter
MAAVDPAALAATVLGLHGLSAGDLLDLTLRFALLSLLAVGGAITTAPDMQRFVVGERGWITDGQFSASIALAQAAPGPNVLFVAVVGFQVAGLAGAGAALAGSLLPSAALAWAAERYGHPLRETLPARAFVAGMAPLTLGLVAASGWILMAPTRHEAAAWLLAAAAAGWMLFTRRSPVWAIAAGGVAGALGWV